jgi:hypothetical protein
VTAPPVNAPTGQCIGVTWGDYDKDGDFDLFATNYGAAASNKLFRNDGNFAFTNITAGAVAADRASAAAFGDPDEDGDIDIFLTSDGGTNQLLRNDAGTYGFQTGGAFSAIVGGRAATWVDFDMDGDLDLSGTGTSTSVLLRGNGTTTFTDVAAAPMDLGYQCITWGDYDNDGDPDAYLSRESTGSSVLARNDNGTFANAGGGVAITTVSSLGSEWGDFDNDGDLDLFVASNAAGANRLVRNDAGTFVNVASGPMTGVGSTYGATWGDFDNDGDLDLVITSPSNPSRLLRNDGTPVFADVSSQLAANPSGIWSATWGDGDGDGDLDLYLGSGASGQSVLLRNDNPPTNHWLHVRLVGTISNPDGSGARVTVVAGGVTRMREMFAGGQGWCSQASSDVEFGLGAATSVTSLTVRWPTGIVQNVSVPGIDRVITVTEPGFTPVAALAGGFTPDQPFDLTVDTFGVNVTTATLFFRAAGTPTFSSGATMTIDGANDRMTAAIPSITASENGVEYVITYQISSGSTRAYPRTGQAAPAFLPANLGTRAQPAAAPANEHVLFGVPFVAGNATFSGVLEDDLGAYDNTKWRFGRFSPSAGTYLEAGNAGSLTPGRGFWIIERNPVVIDAAGVSTNTVGGTSIPVDPGWNQIGHPYLFNVPTSAVDRSDAPNVANRFVSRVSGAYQDVTTLEPWKGYWVFNSGSGTQTIVIPGEVGLPPAPRAATLAERLDWGIEVRARAGSSSDLGNFAAAASAEEAEALTLPEPPGLPGTVRVSFDGGGRSVSSLTTDVRASGRSSETFDVRVETGIDAAELTFDGFASLPSDRAAILVDDAHLAVVSLDAGTKISLDPEQSYLFRLVVGTSSELDRARAGLDLVPTEVVLAAPRPNPFAGETTIAFAIPEATAVDLAVFDVAGRLVRRLQEGPMGAGVHRILWNGTDEGGAKVSTGVYFAKLRTSSAEKVQKVVVLK